MAKFNRRKSRAAVGRGPITATRAPGLTTHEGGPAFARDARSELFLLAVANFVGEDTFYERADDRDARFADLVRQVAVTDGEWLNGFVRWLRADAHMRSASIVMAAEAVRARVAAGQLAGNRTIIDAALQRADEPGEFLGYWTGRFGRALPKAVKRGVSDAVWRLYTERSVLKYDTASRGWRFADVIELVHPTGTLRDSRARQPIAGTFRAPLYRHVIDRRHGRGDAIPEELTLLRRNAELRAAAAEDPTALLDAERLAAAGMTWEDVLSLVGSRLDKAAVWEAMIPSMGIMALARNLRNFDDAEVSDAVAAQVAAVFTDPAAVARSRMFPYRWLAAYENVRSVRWAPALDAALRASLANLPTLRGRTLILVDTSASMTGVAFSRRSTMTPIKAAAVFGVALAAKGERVDLHGFADGVFAHPVRRGASVIREVDEFCRRVGEVGHGTQIPAALRATYDDHDRVFVISDMQTFPDRNGSTVARSVPATVPLYGVNLGGYRPAAVDAGSPNRIEFGGLSDAMFRVIPLIEAGKDAAWPWLTEPASAAA
jgi:hypothetical protein